MNTATVVFSFGKEEATGKKERKGKYEKKKTEKDTRRSAFARGIARRYKTEMDRVKYTQANEYVRGNKAHKRVKGTRLQRDGEERHDDEMRESV